jgi:hypothetical protein
MTEAALWALVGLLHELDAALHALIERLLAAIDERRARRA